MGNKGAASNKTGGAGVNYLEDYKDSIFNDSVTAWENQLTGDEENVVLEYTGDLYSPLNKVLREGNPNGYYKDEIKNLDSALKKFNLKDNITVYRGASGNAFPNGIPEIGSIIQDKGYMSTSVAKNVAAGFDSGYILKIQVPKGKGHGAYVNSLSQYSTEKEFLMPRGTKLKITGIASGESEGKSFNSGQTVVYATYV